VHKENGCSERQGFMTVKEFAGLLCVDPQTVYKWIRQGDLEAEQIKRMRRIRVSEYYRFIGESPR
jgi:excisionase family DNA binding protein